MPARMPTLSWSALKEGLLGLFLSAALELPAVQFARCEIDPGHRRCPWPLRAALNKGCAAVELMVAKQDLHLAGNPGPRGLPVIRQLRRLNPETLSSSREAPRGSRPPGPRSGALRAPLAFLGRPRLGPSAPENSRPARSRRPWDLHGGESRPCTCPAINRPEAVVAPWARWLAAMADRQASFTRRRPPGRFPRPDDPRDFSLVATLNILGAWNLFSAAQRGGLEVLRGPFCVAAIQGNPARPTTLPPTA